MVVLELIVGEQLEPWWTTWSSWYYGQFIGEKIGSFFENRETIEQKEKEYKDQLGKLEKEMDLTAEQQVNYKCDVRWYLGMENFIQSMIV